MLKKAFLFLSVSAILASCSSSTSEKAASETSSDTTKKEAAQNPENELADFKFRTLVVNIPSPFEIITLLPKANVPFKADAVNPVENASKYTTTLKKGLNYGSYIVDLVYLSSNDHYSDLKNYFFTAGRLAKSLEFSESFEKIVGARAEQNIDKKDTINLIMDQVYVEMDNYLRSNDRLQTATHILLGCWVESQYLAVNGLKDETKNASNELAFKTFVEHSYTSKKVLEILKDYENEKEFKPLIDSIKELDKIYSEIHGEADLTKEMFEKIYTKLKNVRTKIIS